MMRIAPVKSHKKQPMTDFYPENFDLKIENVIMK